MTPFRLGIAPPEAFKPAPKNAHFMKQEVYERLVANIRQDGNLATLPFCWRKDGDDTPYTLSGHHRIDAAKDAGVPLVLYLYTGAALSKSQRVAIQLSHNALVGEDNLATLKDLYDQMASMEDMQYSGLDDETIERFREVAPPTFQDARLDFEEVYLVFMPHEVGRVDAAVERLRTYSAARIYAADYQDWEAFWAALLRFKEAQNVVNTATAVRLMVDVVTGWLDEQEAEAAHE